MISIGAFARLTGLTPKTLRHYHDLGLLVPRHVDPATAYRTYELDQMDDAVRIGVLRRGGMSLEQVREVLVDPDRTNALVAEFRAAVVARREREDRALDSAVRAAGRPAADVGEREAPAQPYALVAVDVDLGGADPDIERTDEATDHAATTLRARLREAGIEPVGPFWTRLGADGDALRVSVGWSLPADVTPARLDAIGVTHDLLPARSEAFVAIPTPQQPGDESVQLALAELFRARGPRLPDPRTLRQTVFADRVEFAVELAVRS